MTPKMQFEIEIKCYVWLLYEQVVKHYEKQNITNNDFDFNNFLFYSI